MQLKHFNAVTKYIALALIVCLTFISVTSPVYSLADTKTEYDDNNKELERLKNEQSQLSSELNDLNSELDNAGEKLNSINDRIADTQEQIDSLNEDTSSVILVCRLSWFWLSTAIRELNSSSILRSYWEMRETYSFLCNKSAILEEESNTSRKL